MNEVIAKNSDEEREALSHDDRTIERRRFGASVSHGTPGTIRRAGSM